jgi:hypothetical protein
MRNSKHETGARTTWSAHQPPARAPADRPERAHGTGRPAQPERTHRGELRRAVLLATLALPLAGFAIWYGFLESGGGHPSLKLGGAMALAGIGMTLPVLARPIGESSPIDGEHAHSALVEVHPILLGLAGASMSAALIHFAVIEQHLAEYWLYGWFFVAVAIAQLAWALAAVIHPTRLLLLTGAVGNALVAVVWAVTRAYGSLIGPEATERASVGFGDVASTLLEVAIVAGCLGVLVAPRILRAGSSHRGEVASTVLAIGLTLLTVLGLYSAVAGSPFVSHVG